MVSLKGMYGTVRVLVMLQLNHTVGRVHGLFFYKYVLAAY